MEKKEKFSLKDHLFHREKIIYLASLIHKNYPEFKSQDFIGEVMQDLEKLELKERIIFITEMLEKYLPKDYVNAVEILKKSVPENPDLTKSDDDFGDFIFAPYGFFVAKNGCNEKTLQYSLKSLAYFTQFFSSEWPVRKFFNTFPEETFEFFIQHVKSPNYHIRRWISEGSRPSLPWGEKINFDYKKVSTLLDELFYDQTRYVTRSVANHLNDIAKKDSEFVYEILKKWKNSGKQNSQEMTFIIKHSLRNLIKSGDKKALEFIGFGNHPEILFSNKGMNSEIKIGEYLEFQAEIFSKKSQNILLDYVIFFKTQKGFSKKVFKGIQKEFLQNETIIFSKKHLFREMSTRKLYNGTHKLQIQINGIIYSEQEFILV